MVLLLCYWIKFRRITMQIVATIPRLTNFVLTCSRFLKVLSSNTLILLNGRPLTSMILFWQILLYQQSNASINFIPSLILYNEI